MTLRNTAHILFLTVITWHSLHAMKPKDVSSKEKSGKKEKVKYVSSKEKIAHTSETIKRAHNTGTEYLIKPLTMELDPAFIQKCVYYLIDASDDMKVPNKNKALDKSYTYRELIQKVSEKYPDLNLIKLWESKTYNNYVVRTYTVFSSS